MFLKHPIEIGNLIKKFIYKYNDLISMHILKFYHKILSYLEPFY